jgi:hypothetical protein
VITQTMETTVVKNKSTARDREFWSHVEAVAAQARQIRALTHSQVHDTDVASNSGEIINCAGEKSGNTDSK